MLTPEEIISRLQLQPHPLEGGYFRETHRTKEVVLASYLPRHAGNRSLGTAIYYLLTGNCVSEMHQLPGDEVFHFYLGDPVEQLQLFPDGSSLNVILGVDLSAGQQPQVVVPGGVWQGAFRLEGPHGYSLLGATMAPGFDYADYERGQRSQLIQSWPSQRTLIERLTPLG